MYLGAAYDALRMIMGTQANDQYIDIKKSAGNSNSLVIGPAFTTRGEVVEGSETPYEELDNIRMEIYRDYQDYFFDSNPVVCLEANDDKVAHTGDITSMIYQKMGSVGMLTDGLTRDKSIIDDIGYQVFSKGVNPIDALDYWAITSYQQDITIEGVLIRPGDMVVMDPDGTLIVPIEHYSQWKILFSEVCDRECSIRAMISSGTKTLDEILEEFGRW
jgi:regulator of RNase E activity RraA